MGRRAILKGMTLIEVLIASTLGALLLLSLSAAVGNVFQAYGTGMSETTQTQDIALAMDTVLASIRKAVSAAKPAGTILELKDPSASKTTYGWSGTVGDPLYVSYDSGDPVNLLDGVDSLAFTLNTKEVKTYETSTQNEELFYFLEYPYPWKFNQKDWYTVPLWPNRIYGIEFTVPKDETVEKIVLTQVRVRLGKYTGDDGDLRFTLMETEAENMARPFGPVIASKDLPNGSIPYYHSFDWVPLDLTEAFTIYPNRHYCFLLQSQGDICSDMAMRELNRDPGPDNGMRAFWSFDNGVTWYPLPGTVQEHMFDIPFNLFGDVITGGHQKKTVTIGVDVGIIIDRNGEKIPLNGGEHLLGGIH